MQRREAFDSTAFAIKMCELCMCSRCLCSASLQDDVQQRYVDLVVRPKERAARHELAITKVSVYVSACISGCTHVTLAESKASRPLHMHRRRALRLLVVPGVIMPHARFRMMPPDLYIVPSQDRTWRGRGRSFASLWPLKHFQPLPAQ